MTTTEQSLQMEQDSLTSGDLTFYIFILSIIHNVFPFKFNVHLMFRFGGEGPELAVLDSTDLMCPGKIGKYLLSGCKGVGDDQKSLICCDDLS